VALLMFVLAAACGDDETATSTTVPSTATPTTAPGTATPTAGTSTPSATASATGTEPATGTPGEDIRANFPADVQDLIADAPDALVAALWEIRQQGPGTIIFADFGGETHAVKRTVFVEEWEKITGWTSQSAPFSSGVEPPDFETKMEAGDPQWDLIESGSDRVELFGPRGFMEPIDYSIFPVDQWPEGGVDMGEFYVGQYNGSTLAAYNTEVWPDPATAPTKVSDIFDTENFPGKRCLWGFALDFDLEFALLADGVPADQVFEMMTTKEGRDRAFAKLDTIREDIVFIESGAESVQFLLDGQCDIGLTWNGRPAARLKAEPDLPLKAVHEGAIAWTSPWIVPKGAPNARAAMTLLAYSMLPRNSCENLNTNGYGILMDSPPFPDCLEPFAADNAARPAEAALFFGGDYVKLRVEATDALSEEFNAWKTGG
jgi:putative spermidine/putrescine transport system substrate-binding protein